MGYSALNDDGLDEGVIEPLHDAHVQAREKWLADLWCLAVSEPGDWPGGVVQAARIKLDGMGWRGDVYH